MIPLFSYHETEVDSTQDWARHHLASGEHPWGLYLFYADRQRKGRGRLGRSWVSAFGNLFLTIAVPLDEVQNPVYGPFWLGVRIREALLSLGIQADLLQHKWPNDLLFQGKKVGGILGEAGEKFWFLGVGLNLKSCPSGIEAGDLSPYDLTPHKVIDVLKPLLQASWPPFGDLLQTWEKGGPKKDQPLTVTLPDGREISGTYGGLTTTGALQLKVGDEVQVISTGDVGMR